MCSDWCGWGVLCGWGRMVWSVGSVCGGLSPVGAAFGAVFGVFVVEQGTEVAFPFSVCPKEAVRGGLCCDVSGRLALIAVCPPVPVVVVAGAAVPVGAEDVAPVVASCVFV